jgi:hypothetical protein
MGERKPEMDFWREPVFWSAVATIVALLALILNLRKQIIRKSLSYESYRSDKSPLEIYADKLQTFYEGVEIKNLRLCSFKIMNDGDLVIPVSDFIEPLIFTFSEGTKILTYEIVKSYPSSLKPIFEVDGTTLKLVPLLLNPKDSFYIRILCCNDEKRPAYIINARIHGVKDISIKNEIFGRISKLMKGLLVFSFVGLLLLTLYYYFYEPSMQVFVIGVIVCFLPLIIAIIYGYFHLFKHYKSVKIIQVSTKPEEKNP